mgnify:CR=1 FL=1
MIKSGTLVPNTATITKIKSILLPRFNAEIIPNTRPKEIAKHNARIPRSAEYGNAPANRSLTVRLGYLVEKAEISMNQIIQICQILLE